MKPCLAAALLVAVSAVPAASQTPAAPAATTAGVRQIPEPPRGIGGTVVSVSEEAVVLRQKDGTELTVAMTHGWTVSKPRKATLEELRLGDFIGSANADLAPGKGRANEVRVFEPGYRPEYGTHSIDAAGTSMTHGFVFAISRRPDGTELEIAYPGGRRAVIVPDGTAITVSDLLPRSAAAPGVAVSSVTRPGSDGVRRAARLVLSTPR